MAPLRTKKQKVEHVWSDEDDQASFASFGNSENEDSDNETPDAADGASGSDEEMSEAEDTPREQAQSMQKSNGADRNAVKKGQVQRKQKSAEASLSGVYAAGSFKSNVFKLQVDELLHQIRPRRGKEEEVAEQALHTIKKAIDALPAREALPVDEAERQLLKLSKVAVPFPNPRPPQDAKYKLEYQSPAHINVVGSYALKIASRANPELCIDMTVTMPSDLFQEKDYLNHRYFYKRAYYLACIAAGLKANSSERYSLRFVNFHDDPLKPILTVTPSSDTSSGPEKKPLPKWRINIIPCLAAGVFTKDKLLPSKNCIRSGADSKTDTVQPTPFYNSAVRADMLGSAYLKVLHSAATSASAFRDACLLGSTWLRQRGFSADLANGGFGTFEWATLTALLLQGGGPGDRPILSPGYTSYQMFKAVLQMLAFKDFGKQPLTIGASPEEFKTAQKGSPVIWDGPNSHNILFKTSASSYAHLRAEAKATLQTLNDSRLDGFDPTFILRSDSPLLGHDYVVEIPAQLLSPGKGAPSGLLAASQKIYEVLRRGLGDRVSGINVRLPSATSWKISSAEPSSISPSAKVSIGLSVRSENVSRTVDHGPSADNKREAASFRAFWGDKAELRRFKDGSIMESLVWSAVDGQSILEQVIRHLLARHLHVSQDQELNIYGDGFSRVLRQPTALTAFQPIMEAFKTFENNIRALSNLPLSIRQVIPADSQLRYASREIPVSGKQRTQPADAVIQFEGSARWPDDLAAIQRTKIAFLSNLANGLEDTVDGITCRIGLENEAHSLLNQGFLEVIYESGPAFRLRIHHDREQTLLERQLKDKSLSQTARETAALGLALYKRHYIKTPAHTQAIVRLCNRFGALSGTIRLAKRWIASHLLNNHVAEEVVEMIVARTFLQPGPWDVPNSVQTGFLRTLHWLSRWDWKAEPLIVDLSGGEDLKAGVIQSIQTRFEAWRKLDPQMNRTALFVASNVDQDGTTWTDGRPAKVVASRMTALAKAARAEMEAKALHLDPAVLFTSPLSDFDFVLQLNPTASGSKRRRSSASYGFKNIELADLDDDTLIGYTPAQLLLHELERTYSGSVVFFSGIGQRPFIAGLWNPQTAPRSWRMNLDYSTIPTEVKGKEDVQALINKEGILSEIAHVGGDLVQKVQVNRP